MGQGRWPNERDLALVLFFDYNFWPGCMTMEPTYPHYAQSQLLPWGSVTLYGFILRRGEELRLLLHLKDWSIKHENCT